MAFDPAFISTQLPGQFVNPAAAAAEGEPEQDDTGFPSSLEPFWITDAFPSQLDGARVDVTGATGAIEGCDDAIVDFERAVAAHAHWLNPPVEDAQQSVADDLPPPESPEVRFPLAADEGWEIAEPSEDMAAVQRWLSDAAAEIPLSRLVAFAEPSPRRVVFSGPSWETVRTAPIEFGKFDAPRPTVTVERIWPERPIVATLVVTYSPSGRCRSLRVSREPLVHRFPLALMPNEP
ncbi:MAG TPA: hypothetical protein VGN57_10885 [Pirellulaceae bacterium]|nr:hypothetical protein [Pirellulaceae bacterium]